jgi:hypothetical protein
MKVPLCVICQKEGNPDPRNPNLFDGFKFGLTGPFCHWVCGFKLFEAEPKAAYTQFPAINNVKTHQFKLL